MDRRCSTSFYDSATVSDIALPSAPRLPMYLILVSGGMTGSMFRLSPGENRLGRARENDLLHEPASRGITPCSRSIPTARSG